MSFKYYNIETNRSMNNSEGQQSGKRRVTPADRLKNRLF